MDVTLYRSLLAVDPNTNIPISTNFILSTDGIGNLSWQNVFTNISSSSYFLGYLPSTIYGMSNQLNYFSTGVLPGSLSTPNLTSTVDSIFSPLNYISTGNLISTVDSFLSGNFSFGSNIMSTVNGLGSAGYVSSLSLSSTVRGLGTVGYVSTSSLTSSLIGLGTFGYISSQTLFSSINSLGTVGYVSSTQLHSSVRGLGSAGYVSSSQLISTTTSILTSLVSSTGTLFTMNKNIFINTANSLVINTNSQTTINISSVQNAYFYNSFFNSTINYVGGNGLLTAYQSGYDFTISTLNLQLDKFSSFITTTTKITADIYPNFLFPNITTNSNAQAFTISSFVKYNNSTINYQHQTQIYGINNNNSNSFQQPIRLNLPGSVFTNNQYAYSYILNHRIVNAYASNTNVGFSNSNVQAFFGSTNSYFLSIQNLTS